MRHSQKERREITMAARTPRTPPKPQFNQIELTDRDSPARKVGMGRPQGNTMDERKASFLGFLKGCGNGSVPSWNIPVVDTVALNFGGPLTDAQVNSSFGTTINPLAACESACPAGCTQVDTTLAEPGKFQTYVLICGIQWRIDFEPQVFTALGGGLTTPTSAQNIPPVPDAINPTTDEGAILGLGEGQLMSEAALEWGWWAELAAYYMALGYNLEWQWGNRQTLLRDQLRYTMFAPTVGEGASDSDVDVSAFVRRTNDYYQDCLDSSQIFLPASYSRLGHADVGGDGSEGSVLRQTRAYEFVGATYGGTVLKALLKGNTEFRRLGCPFLIGPGIPIGLRAVQSNDAYANLMRAYLSATQSLGGVIPPSMTPSTLISTGSSAGAPGWVSGETSTEPALDETSDFDTINVYGERTIFKGGNWRLTVGFRGFELQPEQQTFLLDPAFLDRIKSECGCSCYVRG